MRIGLLAGREETFPEALIERLNTRDGVQAEMISLNGTREDDVCEYDVIVDRISHEVPYYAMHLKQAALSGTRIVNNPFWRDTDDKFFGYALAKRLGIAVPKTVLLPNKDYVEGIVSASLRNLSWPMDWEGVVAYTGLPAFIKPADGGGWKGVHEVSSVEELLQRYDQTGIETMVLQEAIDFDRYVRCFCIGRDTVIIARYDVEQRAYLPLGDYLEPELEARILDECRRLNRALGYEMNTVEFAIADGVPYAIDFTNPAPDMEYASITAEYFDRVVDAMIDLVLDLGRARVVLPDGFAAADLVAPASPRAAAAGPVGKKKATGKAPAKKKGRAPA